MKTIKVQVNVKDRKLIIKRNCASSKIIETKSSKRLLHALKELEDVESGKKELIGYNNMTDLINALEEK